MLTLDNFETQVAPIILQRGEDYYFNGNVISIEATGDATWTAAVEGTETYTVEVTLENGKTITDYFCDCPYDGDTCKHAVAVFLALRDEINKLKNLPKIPKKKEVFETLLQSISIKEYQDFIRTYATKHKDFKTEFELFFADKDSRVDVEKKYAELVNKLIKKHADHGFIDYRATSALSHEVNKLLADGDAYLHKQNFKDAFALAKAVLRPIMEAITDADDSNGSIGGSISEVITLLEKIADADAAAVNIKEQLFHFLQTELNNKLYFDYGDFGYEMLDVFQALAIQLNETATFLHFIDVQILKLKGEDDDYEKEHFRKKKIEFLKATGKTNEVEKLIQQSMDIVEVRLAQVNKAIEIKDYATAKKLIADGIKIAEKKEHPGTVDEWQKVLLQIAVIEKDIAAIRYYTKYFAFDRGFSTEYYRMWKATFPPEEWTAVIEKHIEEALAKINKQQSNTIWSYGHLSELYDVAPIYIQEKYWDRLLTLVQQVKSLDTVLEYHDYLAKIYPEELLAIYLPALEAEAHQANTRGQYAELVKKMKKIMKDIPAGKERIIALAGKLKDQFSVKPRRPAMIEELNKILG